MLLQRACTCSCSSMLVKRLPKEPHCESASAKGCAASTCMASSCTCNANHLYPTCNAHRLHHTCASSCPKHLQHAAMTSGAKLHLGMVKLLQQLDPSHMLAQLHIMLSIKLHTKSYTCC